MLNLLRSDLYRLIRSKSFYICTGISVALLVLNAVVLKWASTQAGVQGEAYAAMLPSGGIDFGLSAFGGNAQMLLGIIVGIFVAAEFSHGTMKNVVSKGFVKWKIYLAKFLSMLLAVYFVLFITMAVGVVVASFLFGGVGELTGTFVAEIFKIVGIEILLYVAMTSFFVMVSMVIRNLGGVIAIIIIWPALAEPLLFQLLQLITKNKIHFSEYCLVNNIAFYNNVPAVGDDYLRSAIVALVYLVITLGAGLYIFQKSDIK